MSLVIQLEVHEPISGHGCYAGTCNRCPQKTRAVQLCRHLLVVHRPLWSACTILLPWSKLLDCLLATGALGARIFMCFGHRPLGMCISYYVGGSGVASCSAQKNIAPEQLCLGLFWKEPSRILAWGEAAGVRVMTSCTIGDETAWKPVSRARKSAGLKLSRFISSPLQLKSGCLLSCCHGNLPSLPRCEPQHIKEDASDHVPCANRKEQGLFSFPEIHCELLGWNRMCK